MQPKTFLINLDKDVLRLRRMERILAAAGLEYERFSALARADVPEKLCPFFMDENGKAHNEHLLDGEIGCYASHLSIMTRFVADLSIQSPILVLEDDLRLTENFPRIVSLVAEHMRKDRAIEHVHLTGKPRCCWCKYLPLDETHALIRACKPVVGTGAYLLTRRGAKKFLDYTPKRCRPIDQDLRRVWENGISSGMIMPRIAHQISEVSDDSSVDVNRDRHTAARLKVPCNPYGYSNLKRLMWLVDEFGIVFAAHCIVKYIYYLLYRKLTGKDLPSELY